MSLTTTLKRKDDFHMAQGEFTKAEAKEMEDTFTEVFKALSKPKQCEFLGHANDIYLFLTAAKKAAPEE